MKESHDLALRPTVMSLCSGYGGLDLGVRLACPAARTVCYVEIEAYVAALLVTRMAEGSLDDAPVWSDVKTLGAAQWRGVVDLIIGGYPCQPFSLAGKRLGEADPRHLWPHIARIVGEVSPSLVFFENVPGHLSVGFSTVAEDLQRLGYVVAAGIFSAVEVGATHERERLFIMAHHHCNGFSGQWNGWLSNEGRTQAAVDVERRGEELANSGWCRDDALRLLRVEGCCSTPSVGEAGHEFGNTDRSGCRSGVQYLQSRRNEPNADWSSTELANAQGIGKREPDNKAGTISRNDAWKGVSRRSSILGNFPPGPDDFDRWADYLAEGGPQPAIRRGTDGTSNRMDRLRATGNGVVPDVAAKAFIHLANELGLVGA